MAKESQARDRLLQVLERFPTRKMAVAGDLIADHFLYGEIARVSREAPVLILEYRDLVRAPGGAANAANNLLALGCAVVVVGAVGCDSAGADLVATLAEKGADVDHVARIEGYSTPVKTRILAAAHHSTPQQIVRVDRESKLHGNPGWGWKRLRRSRRGLHGIVVSDYGYGSATPGAVEELRSVETHPGMPLVVDSRFRMAEFSGVTAITPNITELEAAAGVTIGSDRNLLRKIGRKVIRTQHLAALLVTQGRFGMTLLQPRRAPVEIPIYGTDEVADVTGAGDTVIAVFSLALACGGSPEEAARLANYAGGIVVMKRGTATVSLDELSSAIRLDLTY